MLPCSVRRVAASSQQSPFLSSLGSTVPRAAASTLPFSYIPLQRRRYSSSKPSRDNGSEDPPVRQSVQRSAESKSDTKPAGEKRKRKAKDVTEKQKYPRVPTTAHIPSDFFALSSFFSLHRPISVTHHLPRIVSEDAFAAIFAQQPSRKKHHEIMAAISQTVDELEQPLASISGQRGTDSRQATSDLPKIDLTHSDQSESNVTGQISQMSGQFLPFRAPPLPQPQKINALTATGTTAISEEGTAAITEEDEHPHTLVYKAIFTVEETTDSSGGVKILAHSPEMLRDSFQGAEETDGAAVDARNPPRTFLERMALRQLRREDARLRQQRSLYAISVKRQRRLKMKKKKYKKLQKRLRHERLKYGRT